MEKQEMIIVDHVSIKFNLSSEKFDSFKEYVIKSIKGQVSITPFWALKDVSFKVYKGESLGLIGLNGSGKSTMLKTIAGLLNEVFEMIVVDFCLDVLLHFLLLASNGTDHVPLLLLFFAHLYLSFRQRVNKEYYIWPSSGFRTPDPSRARPRRITGKLS